MTSNQRNIAIVAIVGAVLAVGAFVWFRDPAGAVNAPGGTWWLCQNDQCKHEYNLTLAQVSDHHSRNYGKPMACPKCKQTKVARAEKCPHCGKVYPQTRGEMICPSCKKPPTG